MDNYELKCWKCSEDSNESRCFPIWQFKSHNEEEHEHDHVHCRLCPNVFSNRGEMHEHFSEVHAEKKHLCLQCLENDDIENYLAEEDFSEHYKDNHEGYTIGCFFCPNKFTSEHDRDEHMRAWHNHPPVRPKIQCAHCDKKYPCQKDLKDHTEAIHFKCTHFCKNCSNGYETKKQRNDHQLDCHTRYD